MVEFFKDNEKRNLFFSALAIGMTLAITIVALSCSFFMVFAADGVLGFPSDSVKWFANASGSYTEYHYGYPSVFLIKKSNGLCDAVCVGDRLSYYGSVSSAPNASPNTAGARNGTEFHPTWSESGVTYWHLTDVCWYDNLTENNCLTFASEEYAIKALTDPSYEQYALNYDDFPHYNSDLSGLINIYFSSVSPSSATLTIEPTDAYASSDFSGSSMHLVIEPACYCGYFYSNLGKGRLDPSAIYDYNVNLSEDLPVSTLALEKANVTSGVSNNGTYVDYVVNDSIMSSRSGYMYAGGDPLLGTVPKAWLVLWSKELSSIELDWSGGTVNQTINFDASIVHNDIKFKYGPDAPNSHSLSAVTPCAYRAVCNLYLDGRQSTPTATYKWCDTSFFNGNPMGASMTTSSKINPDSGKVEQDSFVQMNDDGTSGVLSNDNIIQFINSGLGFKGGNGFISIIQKTLSFLPTEIWGLIFAALSLSLVLMIIKILRGM